MGGLRTQVRHFFEQLLARELSIGFGDCRFLAHASSFAGGRKGAQATQIILSLPLADEARKNASL